MSSIKLTADSGGGTVELKAPATTGSNANKQFILPQNDGSANQVLKTDGSGNFGFVSNGVSSAQQFRLLNDESGSGSAGTVLSDWEEVDTDYQAIGSNWSQSSGVFSCSATGIYLASFTLVIGSTGEEDAYDPNVQISTNSGGAYTTRARIWAQVRNSPNVQMNSPTQLFMFDVADTSTFRLRYRQSQDNAVASSTTIKGSSTEVLTNIMFIRLGDT